MNGLLVLVLLLVIIIDYQPLMLNKPVFDSANFLDQKKSEGQR